MTTVDNKNTVSTLLGSESLVPNTTLAPTVRFYEIDRTFRKDEHGNVLWRYRIPNSGDYVVEWHVLISNNGGRRVKTIPDLHINDVKIGGRDAELVGIVETKISIPLIRKHIKEIELPKTRFDNTLLKLEQIIHNQQLESQKAPTLLENKIKIDESKPENRDKKTSEQKRVLPKYSREITDQALWMGSCLVELDFGKFPPNRIVVKETFYKYCSGFMFP
jgi:hypothetical protein